MINTRYQYTNFIYPFIVGKKKYNQYIKNILSSNKFSLRLFQKEKDLSLYSYFSNEIKSYLFPTFDYTSRQVKELEKNKDIKEISSLPCVIFDYILDKDYTGKSPEESIFFKINKIELICFKTGICFLNLRTYIDEVGTFADVLNFNYKFKEISKRKVFHRFNKYTNRLV